MADEIPPTQEEMVDAAVSRRSSLRALQRQLDQRERDRTRRELERLARIRGLIAEARAEAKSGPPRGGRAPGPARLLAAIIDIADEEG